MVLDKKLFAYKVRRKPPLDTAMVSEHYYCNKKLFKKGLNEV